MKIRHASTGDTEDWLKLRCALWPEGTRDEHRREIESFLAGTAVEPQAVLLAERDGRIVGFAELSIRSHAEGCTTNRVAFLEGWYVARFLMLRDTVFRNPKSYFHRFASLPESEAVETARTIWRTINGVNLRENIAPTRQRARLVIEKGPDHAARRMRFRRI